MKTLPTGLNGLKKYKQWILWRAVTKANGHVDKLPVDPHTFGLGDAHNPKTWTDCETVLMLHEQHPQFGVGFVFTKEDPFFFVDVDNCATNDGDWNDLAKEITNQFGGAAVSTSSSGVGLHIIGMGKPGREDHKRKHPAGIELYCHSRFVALSLNPCVGDCTSNKEIELNTFIGRYFMPSGEGEGAPGDWTDAPVEGWTGPTDDNELIKKACAKVSGVAAFGGRATFQQLWEGDGDALAPYYPDPSGNRAFDRNRADSALAAHLAFWTGKNCARIERLMRQSGLAREKWDAHKSYLLRTITGACAVQNKIYDLKPPTEQGVDGCFAGCIYISEIHRILTPEGFLLKPDQFRAVYGGPVFRLDASKNTRNAWTAATESNPPAVKKVDCMRFRPLMEPGLVTVERGVSYVNAYKPRFGKKVKGDVAPFLNHVRKLISEETDANIFLSYLAACVQMSGIKFQWAPVVQGTQGNGKTIFYKVLEYALGAEYCYQLPANDVENKFNGWVSNKLLIAIEELRVQGRVAVSDMLKPLITNDRIGVQRKGVDQVTGDNFANFLIFSNHKDAVLKVRDDRRYAVFYTAQQSVHDLRHMGMDDTYFKELYGWLGGGGLAIVADYLARRPITINVLGRAPETSSTGEALWESLGPVEQLILEAVASDEPGFKGGVIALNMAAQYIKHNYKSISPMRLGHILNSLGYVKPPALRDEDSRLRLDGVKTRIYVPENTKQAAIQTREALREFWETANS